MNTETEKDDVFSRWSKRKRSVAEEETPSVEAEANEVTEIDEARAAELLANREAAEAIDLDTIDAESDLSLFMKEGVPNALKRKALSVLWRSNPVFANLDGLNDYDENFADPDLIMKTFTSAYQVGRGYLKEVLEGDEDDTDLDETAAVANPTDEPQEVVEANLTEEEDQGLVEEPMDEAPRITTATDEMEKVSEPRKVSLRRRLNLES